MRVLKEPNDDHTCQLYVVSDDAHLRTLVDFAMSDSGGTNEAELNNAVECLLEAGTTRWREGPELELFTVTKAVGFPSQIERDKP